MRYVAADQVEQVGPASAIAAVRTAVLDGLGTAAGPTRTSAKLRSGEFLLMPAESSTAAGVKVVTVTPRNPTRGLPRIQAVYLLFDSETLALEAILDGAALTTLRTAAVSVATLLPALPERALRLVVFGAGPQGVGHVRALRAVRDVADVVHVVREPRRAVVPAVAVDAPEVAAALRAADVVVCATSAREPLFDGDLLRHDALVVAVGSHEPRARELDAALLGRSTVVVEDRTTALREAGDVIQAVVEGAVTAADLVPMSAMVTGAFRPPTDRPLVFKSVGMAWEDLAVAQAVLSSQ